MYVYDSDPDPRAISLPLMRLLLVINNDWQPAHTFPSMIEKRFRCTRPRTEEVASGLVCLWQDYELIEACTEYGETGYATLQFWMPTHLQYRLFANNAKVILPKLF